MALKIAIDAGHGVHTLGKRCLKKLDPNQTREWTLNDRIADRLENELKAYNCETLRLDDTTGAKDISLSKRVKSANEWKANVVISIHHNAGLKGGKGGGISVYYCSSNASRLIQATKLYDHLIVHTGLKGNRANPVSKGNYTIIKKTNAPAFLIENGFMDSAVDVPIILSEAHAISTVNGIVAFLVDQFKLSKKVAEPEAIEPFRVRVKVNRLNYRAGAGMSYKVKGTVKKGEVYTIVDVKGSWGKLKSGAGWISISNSYVDRL